MAIVAPDLASCGAEVPGAPLNLAWFGQYFFGRSGCNLAELVGHSGEKAFSDTVPDRGRLSSGLVPDIGTVSVYYISYPDDRPPATGGEGIT